MTDVERIKELEVHVGQLMSRVSDMRSDIGQVRTDIGYWQRDIEHIHRQIAEKVTAFEDAIEKRRIPPALMALGITYLVSSLIYGVLTWHQVTINTTNDIDMNARIRKVENERLCNGGGP